MLDREKWQRIQELQKGKHFISILHKPVEDFIVYLLYDLDFISADHVSLITYLLAFYVAYLFLRGAVLYALLLAVIVGILDGVDGKIARLRGRKTYIGKLEHSIDMLYEQTWYATYTWYLWTHYGDNLYLVLGFAFLILDGLVRHIYNTFWIATGKSLKYSGGLAEKVTKIDGRRSVYVLHMIIWYVLGAFNYSIFTILIHCGATAFAYLAISMKYLYSSQVLPS
mgnify:CR=1 FL=1